MTQDKALKVEGPLHVVCQCNWCKAHPEQNLNCKSVQARLAAAWGFVKAQPEPWEKFCDSNCVWTDHHPNCKMAQPDQYAKGYADAMNWKVQNHLEHLPAAQPEQEPVAWCVYCDGQFNLNIFRVKDVADVKKVRLDLEYPNHKRKVVPLYTSPPQRKPLTDEEIILIVAECASSHQHTDIHFARAIEAAHGIKEIPK